MTEHFNQNSPIRMGMVGGGPGAFIGDVHRKAALLDGNIQLVCGAFSRNSNKSSIMGKALNLPSQRVFGAWEDMLNAELKRPANERMQMLSIVTPNDTHFEIAAAALKAGFHVICDKPATRTLEEVHALSDIVKQAEPLYALTHTYLGYPLVKEARARVSAGDIGQLRKIYVEYPQGWLSGAIEADGHTQASWRTDPERAGPSGCMTDIGSHASTLVEYIALSPISHVCADLNSVVAGRRLDDDGAVLLRLENGASGVLVASQVCNGEENNLRIRLYGETGGLEWSHEDPNSLKLKRQGMPQEILRAGSDQAYLSQAALAHVRLPAGHPEGYLEAFANIYRNFALAIMCKAEATSPNPIHDYPSIEDAVSSISFIQAVIENANSQSKWTAVTRAPLSAGGAST